MNKPASPAEPTDAPQLTVTAKPRSTIPPGHNVMSFLAHRLNQVCLGFHAEIWDPEDLSRVEYATLTNLHAAPGIDQQALADRLGVDKATTSQAVDRLVRRGLLDRRPDGANRRANILHLTPEGRGLRERLGPHARAANARIMAPLAPEEREKLIEFMTRIVEAHGSYARPGHNRRRPRPRKPPA
jgi:DNA-binding MarR family transcriptional regulator